MRIADRALVVAAQLTARYITARFLPDKAIDALDGAYGVCRHFKIRCADSGWCSFRPEACASLKVTIESRPVALEQLSTSLMRLQVEEEALKREKDAASVARIEARPTLRYAPLLAGRWSDTPGLGGAV